MHRCCVVLKICPLVIRRFIVIGRINRVIILEDFFVIIDFKIVTCNFVYGE